MFYLKTLHTTIFFYWKGIPNVKIYFSLPHLIGFYVEILLKFCGCLMEYRLTLRTNKKNILSKISHVSHRRVVSTGARKKGDNLFLP